MKYMVFHAVAIDLFQCIIGITALKWQENAKFAA